MRSSRTSKLKDGATMLAVWAVAWIVGVVTIGVGVGLAYRIGRWVAGA